MKSALRTKINWTKLVIASLLMCLIFNFGATAQTNLNTPLDNEGLSALVEKLKSSLAEIVEDEETQTSITEKWDARMEKLVGKTAKQVIDLLLADVKSAVEDVETVNQLKESFIAAASNSESTEEPEPTETPINNPNPPTQPDSNATLGQYIRSLSYNPLSLLAVQGNQAIFEKVLKKDENRQQSSGKITLCTRTTRNLSRNFDEIAILQPTRGAIYPGALLFADNELVNGSPRPLNDLPRAPLNLRLDLPGLQNNGKFTIDDPTEDNVQNAVNEALKSWNNSPNFRNGYLNQSLSTSNSTVAYSSDQLPLSLGFNANWAQGAVSAQFKYASNSEKNIVVVAFKQVFYTVTFDAPDTPEGFFDSSVTAENAKNVFSSANVPAYISSVNYGRIIMLRMETDKNIGANEAEAALQYAAGLVKVVGDTKTKYDNILSNSTITVVTIGANAEVETANVSASNLMPIIKNAVYSKSNQGLPISYTVKFLKDNAVARVGANTDYSAIDCQDAQNKWIEIRQNGAYMADYTVTWDEPGRSGQKVEGRYSAGNKMQVNFAGDATNIRVNLRTMSGVGILDKVLQPNDLNTTFQTGGHAVGPNWSKECKNQAGLIEWKQSCN